MSPAAAAVRRHWWRVLGLPVAMMVSMAPAAPAFAASAPSISAVTPSAGPLPAGGQVEIQGSGFLGATSVLFGDAVTPFTVVSGEEILADVPSAPVGGGTVDVRVVTSLGTSPIVPADAFTFVQLPSVTALVPAQGPTAGGTSVVILGSGFTGATEVDFGAGLSAQFQVVSDGEIVATLPADATASTQMVCDGRRCAPVTTHTPLGVPSTVTVTVTNPAGGSAESPGASFTFLPAPQITTVSPDVAAPAGASVSIDGSGLLGAQAVLFGGVPAAFQVASDGVIQATVPQAASGTSTVTVAVALLPRVVALASGGGTSYAALADGSLWAWGAGAAAPADQSPPEAGCGCTAVPERVSGLPSVTSVAAGPNTAYALAQDGTVWAWGAGGQGQLGDGRRQNAPQPVRVARLQHVVALAAGYDGGYALEADGSVWAWGGDAYGELGSLAQRHKACDCSTVPVKVRVPAATAIGAGRATVYAVTTTGAVWAWGAGGSGQLGDGRFTDAGSPHPVNGVTGAVAVAGGASDGFAVTASGAVWAWGDDSSGQLGLVPSASAGSCPCLSVPVQVAGLPPIVRLAAGDATVYAADATGAVWAWGDAGHGELGAAASASAAPGGGAASAAPNPTSAVPARLDVPSATVLAASGGTALAADAVGDVVGWGDGSAGQLGPAALQSVNAAPVAQPFWSDASAAGPGSQFTYLGS